MACGCGGNGGQSLCSEQSTNNLPQQVTPVQEMVPEFGAAMTRSEFSQPETFQPDISRPEIAQPATVDTESGKESAAINLIASSDQEWPRIKVNGVSIAPEAIAQELQYHPASTRDEAVFEAAQALVIRELLQQRISALNIRVVARAGESEEEAATRTLIEREVTRPEADEAACLQYFQQNRQRFASAPLLAVRHILLACPWSDVDERSRLLEQARALITTLQAQPDRFTDLVNRHSACPSKEQGGALGQISQGQTVPEFERQLFRLPPGLADQPLESRYGIHVVWVEQRIEGRMLPYEAVKTSIREELNQRVWQVSVAQYLKNLVGQADIQGIVLEGAETPLLQ